MIGNYYLAVHQLRKGCADITQTMNSERGGGGGGWISWRGEVMPIICHYYRYVGKAERS